MQSWRERKKFYVSVIFWGTFWIKILKVRTTLLDERPWGQRHKTVTLSENTGSYPRLKEDFTLSGTIWTQQCEYWSTGTVLSQKEVSKYGEDGWMAKHSGSVRAPHPAVPGSTGGKTNLNKVLWWRRNTDSNSWPPSAGHSSDSRADLSTERCVFIEFWFSLNLDALAGVMRDIKSSHIA